MKRKKKEAGTAGGYGRGRLGEEESTKHQTAKLMEIESNQDKTKRTECKNEDKKGGRNGWWLWKELVR